MAGRQQKEPRRHDTGMNHLMHESNIYRDSPPDFAVLASKYDFLGPLYIFVFFAVDAF